MKKLFLFLLITCNVFAQAADELAVTYIANEGFLISCGGKNILIDALFNQSFGKYDPPSDELKAKIISGQTPFDKVDLYLLTHNHGDHFYAPYVNDFLELHNKTIFVSSSQACDQLESNNKIKDRVKDIPLELGKAVNTEINGIPFKIFRLKHLGDTTGTIALNYSFLINLNGIKIFHPGDITFEFDKSLLVQHNLEKENIDVLFIPYFDLSEASTKYVKEIIKPKHIIAIHIPPADFETARKDFLNTYPKGIVFEKPMDKKSIK